MIHVWHHVWNLFSIKDESKTFRVKFVLLNNTSIGPNPYQSGSSLYSLIYIRNEPR